MSLRIFHLVFIGASAAFAAGFVVWLAGRYAADGNPLWLAAAAGGVASSAAMAIYGVRFRRATRALDGAAGR